MSGLTRDDDDASLLQGGEGPPVLFLHGCKPGQPYASGAHIWGPVLDLFAASGHRFVAPDLPPIQAGFDQLVTHSAALLQRLGIGPAHIVGHDEGGLVALRLALDAPRLVRSVTVVSSIAAAPSGDGVENLTLANPPHPFGTRASQLWALERLSYDRHHVTAALLDACVRRWAGSAAPTAVFTRELMGSKARLYEACRGAGVPVPVQLIWSEHDPLSTLEHAETLHRLIGARQVATQCHILNRVGYFPFREEPETFHRLVKAFLDGLALEAAAA